MRQQTRDLRSGLPAAILAVAVAVSLIVVPAGVRADSFLTTWFRPGCQAPPVYPPAEAPFPPAARFPAARFPAARYPAAEVPADSVVPYAAEPPVA